MKCEDFKDYKTGLNEHALLPKPHKSRQQKCMASFTAAFKNGTSHYITEEKTLFFSLKITDNSPTLATLHNKHEPRKHSLLQCEEAFSFSSQLNFLTEIYEHCSS